MEVFAILPKPQTTPRLLKHIFTLTILTLLCLALLPELAHATTETLTCNAFDSTFLNWTGTGGSPYLDAPDTNYVSTQNDDKYIGNFSFPDTSLTSFSTVTAIKIYVRTYDNGKLGRVYYYDGTNWARWFQIGGSEMSAWQWENSGDIDAYITSLAEINSLAITLYSESEVGTPLIRVEEAYIQVTYTSGATALSLYGQINLAFTVHGTRQTSFTRWSEIDLLFNLVSESSIGWNPEGAIPLSFTVDSEKAIGFSWAGLIPLAFTITNDKAVSWSISGSVPFAFTIDSTFTQTLITNILNIFGAIILTFTITSTTTLPSVDSSPVLFVGLLTCVFLVGLCMVVLRRKKLV